MTSFVRLSDGRIHKVNTPALNQATSLWGWESLSYPPPPQILLLFQPPLDAGSSADIVGKLLSPAVLPLISAALSTLQVHLHILQRIIALPVSLLLCRDQLTWVTHGFGLLESESHRLWQTYKENETWMRSLTKAEVKSVFRNPVWTGAQEMHVHPAICLQTSCFL